MHMLEQHEHNENLGLKIPIQDLIQSSSTSREIFHGSYMHFGTTPYITSRNTTLPTILDSCLEGN